MSMYVVLSSAQRRTVNGATTRLARSRNGIVHSLIHCSMIGFIVIPYRCFQQSRLAPYILCQQLPPPSSQRQQAKALMDFAPLKNKLGLPGSFVAVRKAMTAGDPGKCTHVHMFERMLSSLRCLLATILSIDQSIN
jgi:hypothetical protein